MSTFVQTSRREFLWGWFSAGKSLVEGVVKVTNVYMGSHPWDASGRGQVTCLFFRSGAWSSHSRFLDVGEQSEVKLRRQGNTSTW